MSNEMVLKVMQTQLKTWQDMRRKDLSNMCLVVGICEIKDDIKVIEKAIELNTRYSKLLETQQEEDNTQQDLFRS